MPISRRATGVAFIAGSVLLLATMALHPMGKDLHGPDAAHMIAVNKWVHAMALLGIPVLCFAGIGMSGLIDGYGRSLLATVFYCAGSFTGLSAGIINGFVVPELNELGATDAAGAELLGRLSWMLNQAFTKVYVGLSSLGLLIWCVHLWRSRMLHRAFAGYGAAVAVVTLVLLISGHLHMDVHGFGLVVLLQASWCIGVGVALIRHTRAVM
jgi:hypothetical protein